MARPFFRYYGSKWRGARHYGPPRRDLVIEPFAGPACYSVYWDHPDVALYDLSEDVCAAWDWLIHCSEDDIRRVPDGFGSNEEWLALPDGPRQVVYWSVVYASPAIAMVLPEDYHEYCRTGEVTGRLARFIEAGGGRVDGIIWTARTKDRLIRQNPLLAEWTIEQLDYRDIPLREAHWHVDPPYQGPPGRAYPHSEIDYDHLRQWCIDLPGAVDVCENEGADWLPFRFLYDTHSVGRRDGTANRTREVVWQKEPSIDDMFGWD